MSKLRVIQKDFSLYGMRTPFMLLTRGIIGKKLPDSIFLKMRYYAIFGKKLNLKTPRTYSEKLQWLKLFDRKKLYNKLVDKYEVKEYVSNIIGEQYIIKTLGVWDCFDDIDFCTLPSQFVLKTTHDSGGIVICKEKSKFDIEAARKKINQSLNNNFYYTGREWPYKDLKPRIIAEEYKEDSETEELRDYKFFCFDGAVKALFIASDRQIEGEETKFDFFDENYNHLPFINGHPNAKVLPSQPKCFEEMKELAGKLSKGFPEVRVDFYEVDGSVYFGELTFFHWSGLVPFEPEMWDEKFGSWINLPKRQK